MRASPRTCSVSIAGNVDLAPAGEGLYATKAAVMEAARKDTLAHRSAVKLFHGLVEVSNFDDFISPSVCLGAISRR
jgi:hypothetical protein